MDACAARVIHKYTNYHKAPFMTSYDLQLFLDNLRQEVSFQGEVTKVKLEPLEVDMLDTIKSELHVEGRTFSFDPSSAMLTIDSTNCPIS
jgi:hypothetical protein